MMNSKLTRKEVMQRVKLARKNNSDQDQNKPSWVSLRAATYNAQGAWPNHFASIALPQRPKS